MRCDVMEEDEQIVTRFLGGLRHEISNSVLATIQWLQWLQ
ncbi:hypothetical protein Patl1_12225 [Pistacia atlantica]|uniref:Uncharacterized protein n=1 Tax=Pistacia atlantica TaxID=434234 RepID=A0ACC1A7P8_9ROSI|nr:hypothetical protein Patl1_12225 [Pistacia atlantica]